MGRGKRMNNYYFDEILRMSVEMALFMIPGGNSINRVARGLQVDNSLIREDVLNLFVFDKIRGLLQVNMDNSINEDEEMLDSYQLAYYELINMHNDMKRLEKEGKKYNKEKFEFEYGYIPDEFDIDGVWKKEVLNLFSGKGKREEVDMKALLKNVDNARVRVMRRIKGTSENGTKKGRNRDGERYGILSGKYDDTTFVINDTYLNYDGDGGEFMLALSGEEYTHLNEFLEKRGTPLKKMDGLFKVKNSLEIRKEETELKYDVLEKIKEDKCIKFKYYKRKAKKIEWVKIKPRWINYNADTGLMYIVDSDEYSYRVDCIVDGKVFELEKGEKPDKKRKLAKRMVDMVIDIPKRDGYDGLIFKIKEDVGRRNMNPNYKVDEHFSEESDRYVYRDKIDVNDYGNIKSWIYSYGSSMVVEKPEELRRQIIESYKVRSEYY